MATRVAAATLATLLLLGCDDAEERAPIDRSVRLACEPAMVEACEAAIAVWAPALHSADRSVSMAPDAIGRVVTVASVETQESHCGIDGDTDFAGCYGPKGIEVWAPYWRDWGWKDPSDVRDSILAHEIGHALGLGDLERGIMHSGVQVWRCVDSEAAAEIAGAVATCDRAAAE